MLRTAVYSIKTIDNIDCRLVVLVDSNREYRRLSTKRIELIDKSTNSNCFLRSKRELYVLGLRYRAYNE